MKTSRKLSGCLALTCLIAIACTSAVQADPYSENILALDPVSYWRLGETQGTTAYDETGLQNAVYHNVLLDQPGSLEYSSDGSIYNYPGYVEIPHNDAYLMDSGTFLFSFQDLNSIRFAGLFSKDSTGYDTGGHLTALTTTDRKVQVRLQSVDASYYVESDPFITLDTWYDIAFTFGAGGMKLYVDGTLVDTTDYFGGLGLTSGGIGNYEPMALGANTWSSGDGVVTTLKDFFSGRLDEFAVFDYALTDGEIQSLHQEKIVPEPADAVLLLLGVALATSPLSRRRLAFART